MITEHRKEWLKFWKEHGKPHPSSNKYIGMTRLFYYLKGMEDYAKMEDKWKT